MEDIDLSSNGELRAMPERAQADRDEKRPAARDAERPSPEVDRRMTGFLVRAFCCIALWVLASRLLAIAFACSVTAALVALWITASVAFVVHGVVVTLSNDHECSQGES